VQPVRAERLVREPPGTASYEIAFLDPPYDLAVGDVHGVLADLLAHGWLTGGAVVAVERSSRDPAWTWPAGFEPGRSRRYGEATLWYGSADPAAGPPPTTEV
jgi:16S rRNA (guanine966-N2)-methyltransferase